MSPSRIAFPRLGLALGMALIWLLAVSATPATAGSMCITSSLDAGDPAYNRAGTTFPPCALFGTTGNHYEQYPFTVSGCASPTVTVSTCGDGACGAYVSALDSVVFVYQKAGGAGGALIFDPANPCTNMVAANNNACSPRAKISAFALSTTSNTGEFVVVVTGNLATDLGAYNVSVDVGAGCTLTQPSMSPDLTILKTHSPMTFRQGDSGDTYTITVTNGGTGPTTAAVSVVDSVPSGLTATGLSGGMGMGWNCNLGIFTCSRMDVLGAGASYPPITLTVSVDNNAPSMVTNSVTVSGEGETNTANDTFNDPTTIIQAADMTIASSHVGCFGLGQMGATYTLTVTNSGPGPTVGAVNASDTLPAGLTATAISGMGWTSCTQPGGPCSRSDALGAGLSYPPITLTVNVAGGAPSMVTNMASVSGGGQLVTANDSSSDPTTIDGQAPTVTPPGASTTTQTLCQ